jgi:type VI secretion system protein ImpE
MNARKLFEEGRAGDAERELSVHLRNHPEDTPARTFLFELLCFSGHYERARKQLSILADSATEGTELGAILCFSAIHAEETRHALFREGNFPREAAAPSPPGVLNGKPFRTIRDADPDIGERLEMFAAGSYIWIPFAHLSSVEIRAPKSLRETLWTPALVQAGPSFKGKDLGEVMIPAIYPFSWKHSDERVWLGRLTSWMADDEGREYPMGQKLLLVDGEEVPLLEVRTLEFAAGAGAAS